MGSAHCPNEVNIWPKFRENPPQGKGDTEQTQNSRLKHMTLNCDLVSLHGWAMGSAHQFTEANSWPKLKENPSRGKGDSKWTRNSGLKLTTLNCDLVLVLESPWLSYGFCTSSHRWTFDQNLEKILLGVKEIQSGHKIQGSNPWPWTVTLTLSLHGWVIDSAHRPTKVNIWPKFKENRSTGIGDIEWTQNSRLKPVTLTLCRHDWVMRSAHLTEANIRPKFKENPSRGIGDMEHKLNFMAQSMTLTCDLELHGWHGFCTSTHWGEHLTKV